MSFLVSYNGQFSPLVTSVNTAPSNLIHPISNIHPIEQTPEFKQVLEESGQNLDLKRQPHKKLEIYQQTVKKFEETRKRIYAKDIMTSPANMILENAPATQAKDTLTKFGYRHLPVINFNKVIVGMITDRETSLVLDHKTCLDIMNRKVIVAEEHASINEIAIIFLQEKINALPIVNSKHELVGIVTQSDILKYVIETTAFLGKG